MRFAHISDIHLGFQKYEALQKIEQQVFEKAIDECISRKVDFVLIPGDIFHVNIPEMRVQKFAFAKFRQLYDAKIPVYVVYGSHDFSPVSNSVIDLLAEIGYIIKVTKAKSNDDGTISLGYTIDEKTGVKMAGLSGLKVGKDREWYQKLDRSLEAESGMKIFLFHGGVADMKVDTGMDGELMPLSLLPKGFSYYAGGHMHKFNYQKFDGYPHVVYPGTPFAGYYADLEDNARGVKRGLVIVEFEDVVKSVDFIPLENIQYEIVDVNAENKKAESINQELQDKTKDIEPQNKVVIIKVKGEMTTGKTSDVDVLSIKENLIKAGSLVVNISKNQLASKEYSITAAKGENKEEIETNIFKENIGQFNFTEKKLQNENGVKLAKELLGKLTQRPIEDEKKIQYSSRICQNALAILGLDKDDS